MINLYSMQFGLLATLGSIGIQAAMFFTMVFYVRVAQDACPIDSELNELIVSSQSVIWWWYAVFHFLVAITMTLREINDTPDHNVFYEIFMVALNITQIGLLCKTMQQIFVEQELIYQTCLVDQDIKEMPLNY